MKAIRTNDRDGNESTDLQSCDGLVTDGGIIEAGNGAEILDDDHSPGDRPDGCECVDGVVDLPCWECYSAGFDSPNPDAEEGETA